jgi:xylan 1,4-beta-xylosidase
MNIATQLLAVEQGMKVIASFPEWKHTPIILGESDPEGCAACQGSQNGYRNGPLYGVSVAEATLRTYELARKYGVTVEGAVTWAFEFEDQPPFAGFRELATNGIDKPVLNVFRMMGMLGGGTRKYLTNAVWVETESSGALPLEQVLANSVPGAPDVNAVATRSSHEVDVLVWNYHDTDVAAPEAPIHLSVDGLNGKSVSVAEFRMDATHSNAYRIWQQIGSPAHPSPEQIRQLQIAGALEETVKDHTLPLDGGKTVLDSVLPRQGVMLVRLRER